MKFSSDINDKPFKIDGTSTLTITFEVGDIFIDINNKVIGIKEIHKNKIEFVRENNKKFFEKAPLSNDFMLKYRFAGTVQDDKLPVYEEALSLYNEQPKQ